MQNNSSTKFKDAASSVQYELDYLTNLSNRRGLYQFYSSIDKDSTLHAMFIDIDNFKRVNDVYGHSMGDGLLVGVSNYIKDFIPGFISRIGGDEFVILLDDSFSEQDVEEAAKKLLSNFNSIDFRQDILSLISLSIGIILTQSASQSLDDVLAKCDSAMYQAKFDGKNRYYIYKAYDKTLETNRNIENEMESALERREFVLYFQPKMNMVTSNLYGAEILSRWNHPVDGIRAPFRYIPLFEKNGFIRQLDLYMFDEACRLKASWKGKKYEHIPLSINMSRLHLYNKNFPDELKKIAKKHGIPTEELELEITENTFIKDNAELINVVTNLKRYGFLVSIDDFGSGFSALNLLKDLPVDTIKIDKDFLKFSSDDIRGKKILRYIIAMCKDLKMDIVTEGVETHDQVEFLTSCGCQIAQGYYYSKPVCVDDFIKFAEENMSISTEYNSFRFNGNIDSEDGLLKPELIGDGFTYEKGIFKDSLSLSFPGGPNMTNVVSLPVNTIVNDSYTVSMWLRPRQLRTWAAALYIKFETGFSSIIPNAWEGYSDFRIRDSKEVNGWYDVSCCQLQENVWINFAVTYNAKSETATAYLNGEVAGLLRNVPANRYVKMIVIGGDVFQPSYVGDICEVLIYNETKDFDFMKNLYESYVSREDFIAW